MSNSSALANGIASCVLAQYQSLPKKYNPTTDGSGARNWTILSGIVLEYSDQKLECVSLATGLKCLPSSKVSTAKGRILHDSHAEILALRGFNHVLLKECENLLDSEDDTKESRLLVRQENNQGEGQVPFTIKDGIRLHMYTSEAPCGDASMELVMERQDDATPWVSELPAGGGLLGRGHFDHLGAVRRKPSRADSLESLSKSCSDKLAMKQCLSVLSIHTSIFVSPKNAYLSSLIIPESQIRLGAIKRCFGVDGRMNDVRDIHFDSDYSFRPFEVVPTSREFEYSKRLIETEVESSKPSTMAIIWSPYCQEVIINGVLQGRKQTDSNCASMIARSNLARLISQLRPPDVITATTYTDLKCCSRQLKDRRAIKQQVIVSALPGWVANTDGNFALKPS